MAGKWASLWKMLRASPPEPTLCRRKKSQLEPLQEIDSSLYYRKEWPMKPSLEQLVHLSGTRVSLSNRGPLDEGSLSLPEFKALLDLTGLPPHLNNEDKVARALDRIGTYLGAVPSDHAADASTMTVMVAVDKLERIPDEVAIHVKGVTHFGSHYTQLAKGSSLHSC